jgi:HIV Tat-specific factor 1
LGEVTNVVLFDKEPDGVASVRFTDAQAAEACVRVRMITFGNDP